VVSWCAADCRALDYEYDLQPAAS
ncbi:hypothetical protein A2U01_0079618, partial [Trifolium medium]|nr:hypothetical protein [Trifolium medium]